MPLVTLLLVSVATVPDRLRVPEPSNFATGQFGAFQVGKTNSRDVAELFQTEKLQDIPNRLRILTRAGSDPKVFVLFEGNQPTSKLRGIHLDYSAARTKTESIVKAMGSQPTRYFAPERKENWSWLVWPEQGIAVVDLAGACQTVTFLDPARLKFSLSTFRPIETPVTRPAPVPAWDGKLTFGNVEVVKHHVLNRHGRWEKAFDVVKSFGMQSDLAFQSLHPGTIRVTWTGGERIVVDTPRLPRRSDQDCPPPPIGIPQEPQGIGRRSDAPIRVVETVKTVTVEVTIPTPLGELHLSKDVYESSRNGAFIDEVRMLRNALRIARNELVILRAEMTSNHPSALRNIAVEQVLDWSTRSVFPPEELGLGSFEIED